MRRKSVYQARQEIRHVIDRLGMPIDRKIQPLVMGLRCHGVITEASCQGHLHRGLSYPWVHFPMQELKQVLRILRWHNRIHTQNELPKTRWGIRFMGIRNKRSFRIQPKNPNQSLRTMQHRAERFGYLLQSTRSL